jgi:hypothetical protein
LHLSKEIKVSKAFISREAFDAATAVCSVNGIPYDRIEFRVSRVKDAPPGSPDICIHVSYLLKGKLMVTMPVEEMHPSLEAYTLAVTGMDGRVSASISDGVKDAIRPIFSTATHGPTFSMGAWLPDDIPKSAGNDYYVIEPTLPKKDGGQ